MSERKDADYLAVSEKALQQIKKGAFLTVKALDLINTMTIGWATLGVIWNKPIFMVAVRDSRHTYTLLEKAVDFTVSVPTVEIQEKLMFCGTKSGRDINKFQACGLETVEASLVGSPIIKTPGIHFECRIVYKTPMDPQHLTPAYEKLYPQKDYHTLYFGEIQKCYEIE